MSEMEPSDADLCERARAGNREAFDALLRRYLRAAYAVALAGVGNPADAEDVAQDAFVLAIRKIEKCRHPERFGAWLLQIVRNRARNFNRSHRVRRLLRLEDVGEPAGKGNPLQDAERADLKEHLLAALPGLTELQRQVLLLYDFEGWPHDEIAAKLGISPGSARVHLHNARRALRQRLGVAYKKEA